MYDLQLLQQELRGLINWAAHKYCSAGHPILNKDDMIAEGWFIFAKISNFLDSDRESSISFTKLFKSSLFNHYNTMLEHNKHTKKSGFSEEGVPLVLIDLSEVTDSIGIDQVFDIFYDEYVHHIKQSLRDNKDSLHLFQCLIEPPEQLMQLPIKESFRKNHLYQQGYKVRGQNVVRLKHRHYRQYLHFSEQQLQQHLLQVKSTILRVIH